jgi:hypothetical protein
MYSEGFNLQEWLTKDEIFLSFLSGSDLKTGAAIFITTSS